MRKRKGCLVRVGIDSTSGGWNAPVNVHNEFAYVPIPEEDNTVWYPGCLKTYSEFIQPCNYIAPDLLLPSVFSKRQSVHLDPDFSHVTYGDVDGRIVHNRPNHRGKPIANLCKDDILVFYASLRPAWEPRSANKLVFAIIGLYVLAEEPFRGNILPAGWSRDWNAHTRHKAVDSQFDIIAVASKDEKKSGRLTKCIPIGYQRKEKHSTYWLQKDLYRDWGGFNFGRPEDTKRDSLCLQRSGTLPRFLEAETFYQWFLKEMHARGIEFIKSNNP